MRSIWAVACNTIRQALRMKVAVVFLILLLVLLPVMGISVTGDGTLKGRLQTFVSYGLSLTGILLCLLTIIVSIHSLTSDIEQRQIYTVLTKPIRRFELLLGKLLGVVFLDIALLVVFSAIIYAITIYMPGIVKTTEDQLRQVNNEFFTARGTLSIPKVDVSKQVKDRFEQLQKSGGLPADLSHDEIMAELTQQAELSQRAAEPGSVLVWDFDNVKPLSESIFIRFKYDVSTDPLDSQVYGRWVAGDYQFIRYGEIPKTPIYDNVIKDSIRTFHEIEIPAEVVPENGHLAIAFMNVPDNDTVIIFPPDGFEVLYKADSFTNNFIRSVMLILVRLVFLACLGICASTFLSFPVAMLVCLVLFTASSFSGFVLDSFKYLGKDVSTVYIFSFQWMVQLLPQFDKYNPAKFLVPARLLSWSVVAGCAFFIICIRALLMLVIALVVFSFREIAKITV
jgi:hypothetical protein